MALDRPLPGFTFEYLTAVLELLPSNRKAAALLRANRLYDSLFWQIMENAQDRAVLLSQKDPKEQRKEIDQLGLSCLPLAAKAGLPEALRSGLHLDLKGAIGSYVSLTRLWREATIKWDETCTQYVARVNAGEADLRLPGMAPAAPGYPERDSKGSLRPMTLVRERDCMLVRNEKGNIAAVLNVLSAKDEASAEAVLTSGTNAATGESVKPSKRKTVLILPVACSKWHEDKFLSGKSLLKSCKVIWDQEAKRWNVAACFRFTVRKIEPPDNSPCIGIDRGIINPICAAIVDETGAVLQQPELAGEDISSIIRRANQKRAAQQKRGKKNNLAHFQAAVDAQLHVIAKKIVADALKYRAIVVIEDLTGLKRMITTKRAPFARKGGWGPALKKAQLGKFEFILNYKLRMAGLPEARHVPAAGTSQTCAHCGMKDALSRPKKDAAGNAIQNKFVCISCGREDHADKNASIVVGQRGIILRQYKKGFKYDVLHKDMAVARNGSSDDGLRHTTDRGSVVVSVRDTDHAAALDMAA